MNPIFKTTFLIALCALFTCCGQSHSHQLAEKALELDPGDFLYDNSHIYAQGYDGDDLVELHLFNDSHGYYAPNGGPDAITIMRGNINEDYTLRLESVGVKDDAYDVTYQILDDGEDKGTVCFRGEWYEGQYGTIVLKNNKREVVFPYTMLIDGNEELIPREDASAAIRLIAALNSVDRISEDWPIAAKNLDLFLHRDLEYGKIFDFTPLNEFWEIVKSSDGRLTSFLIDYYMGGNGAGSFNQRQILQFWSDGANHVIEDFDRWIWEAQTRGYNFPYLYSHRIHSWGKGADSIYFFEYSFIDDKPMPFDDGEHAKEYISILGAFRIVNGSIVPVKVIKTKSSTLNMVIVESSKEANYKLDTTNGVLGVPLIETDDYQHHGKYILYEWNPKSQLFEYNGRKERL